MWDVVSFAADETTMVDPGSQSNSGLYRLDVAASIGPSAEVCVCGSPLWWYASHAHRA